MGLLPRKAAPAPVSLPSFDSLYARAAARKGEDELGELLGAPPSTAALRRLTDDRALSTMTQAVFSAGFVWNVVKNKWPGFEAAFNGFAPNKCAALSESDIDELATDTRIIRNRQKIAAVRDNARFILDVAAEHGSFGNYLAAWPDGNIVGLWREMSARGSRLGGFSGPFVLRHLGKDTFMITRDVGIALVREGVVDKPPTSQRALAATQAAFNAWRTESGRPLAHISKILAYSVD